jgi:hypothetical protein
MRLRSLLFLGFGLVAAALIYIAPASTADRAPGIYDVAAAVSAYTLREVALAPVSEHAALVAEEREALKPDRMTAATALGPVYKLSLETDGRSLYPPHMRC